MYRKIMFVMLIALALAGCRAESGSPTPTPAANPATAVPTSASAPDSPTPTLAPTPTATQPATPAADLTDLIATVQATLPANAYDGVQAIPLYWPQDERPLFAVYSTGLHSFDLDPQPNHFVAIYTNANGQWQELARQSLLGDIPPTIIPEQGVTQVGLDPNHIWLMAEGIVGAHGGSFHLLQFDGRTLQTAVTAGSASPGIAYLEDLNGDDQAELILRQHDFYVFCYACGMRLLNFRVFAWDAASQQLQEVVIQPLPASEQNHPAYTAVNRAVALAQAGLWPDALTEITAANDTIASSATPLNSPVFNWDMALIRLYVTAWEAELNHTPYPLLTQIFFGDYQAALSLIRPYPPDQIFATPSPLIQGTAAEGNEQWLADYILTQTNAAISARPDLAAAYFFRAWGRYLQNPAAPQIAVDLAQAATLAPDEPIFASVSQPPVNRIQFAPGATAAQVEGQLPAQGEMVYVLSAQAAQQMTVDIFAADDTVRLTVTDANGRFLNGQVTPTLWLGQLPETADYLIRVHNDGSASADYTLNVTIPARITFAPGATSATVSGDLAARQSVDYILTALEGQTMTVVIESDTDNVLLTIVGADGIPLTNGLMSGAMSWTGQLPATQDYILRAIGTFDATAYTLTVTIE